MRNNTNALVRRDFNGPRVPLSFGLVGPTDLFSGVDPLSIAGTLVSGSPF